MKFESLILIVVLLSCAHMPRVHDFQTINSNDLNGYKYYYRINTVPEPWYYIIEHEDSICILRTILFSKGTKYVDFGNDTLTYHKNGRSFWEGRRNNYFYKYKDKYYYDNMEMDQKGNRNIDSIIDLAIFFHQRDSIIRLDKNFNASLFWNQVKEYMNLPHETFRVKTDSILKVTNSKQ